MKLVVDSSIFVAAFIRHEPEHSRARKFATDVFFGVHDVIVPTIFIVEVICALSRRYGNLGLDKTLLKKIEFELENSTHIACQTIDRALARQAVAIGKMSDLRGMDAIYAATALDSKLQLLSEDKAFKKANPPISVISLTDLY